jgi:hypothetical protein
MEHSVFDKTTISGQHGALVIDHTCGNYMYFSIFKFWATSSERDHGVVHFTKDGHLSQQGSEAAVPTYSVISVSV